MRILPMDDDLLKYLEGFGLARGVVPPGSYKDVVNNTQAIPTITMANTIVANAKVPEGPVYEFTKIRSEEHTSELQSRLHLVCRLLLEKKKNKKQYRCITMQVDQHTPPLS